MRSLALDLQRVLAFSAAPPRSGAVSSLGWFPSFGGAQETKRLVLKDSVVNASGQGLSLHVLQ